jgi:Exonuclease I
MPKTYLFYDIETSGLNKCFDQVLQFAAIRTDLNLQELGRYEFFIKLNPDVIPTPTAVLVHQLTLDQMQSGLVEYEAIKAIHRLFNTPGTISVGYNSLGFDDEFLRFSFYRNLLTPYTHQYANDCGRLDIYPLVVMYYLFKPEVVAWPTINGAISLKLEHLNAQNKLFNWCGT